MHSIAICSLVKAVPDRWKAAKRGQTPPSRTEDFVCLISATSRPCGSMSGKRPFPLRKALFMPSCLPRLKQRHQLLCRDWPSPENVDAGTPPLPISSLGVADFVRGPFQHINKSAGPTGPTQPEHTSYVCRVPTHFVRMRSQSIAGILAVLASDKVRPKPPNPTSSPDRSLPQIKLLPHQVLIQPSVCLSVHAQAVAMITCSLVFLPFTSNCHPGPSLRNLPLRQCPPPCKALAARRSCQLAQFFRWNNLNQARY